MDVPHATWLLLFLATFVGVSADSSDGPRAMGKVVKVLQEMSAQLEKEQKEDEDIYDAFACWCETNDKAKTKAIEAAEQHSLDTQSAIEELVGRTAGLKVKIGQLEHEISENEQGLAKATAIRDKEGAEFQQTETDAIQAIGGLKNAVQVLSGHHGDTHNAQQAALMQLRKVLKGHLSDSSMRKLGIPSPQRRAFASMLQQSSGQPAGYAQSTNAAQSGQIYGVLKSMKESFETNYETAKKDEASSLQTYAELNQAKTRELSAAKGQYEEKKSVYADSKQRLAASRIDLEDTSEQLEADRFFLADLKDRCGKMDAEWDNRQKVRMQETTAVNEAIKILNDDEARDTFQRATTFVQRASKSNMVEEAGRSEASRVLRVAALRLNKPKLAALAIAMKGDVFSKMKASLDDMVATLKQDQGNEVKKKDMCIEELHKNAFEMESRYRDKSDLETKIADFESMKERGQSNLQAAKDELAQTRVEMKRAAENRKKQAMEFQNIIADQRTTQDLLDQALTKLQNFYNKVSIREAELLQLGQPAEVGGSSPPGFKKYKKAGGSGGVMGMIREIISESELEEQTATKSEQEAQTAYEEFVRDSNTEVKALLEKIADLTEQLARVDADLRPMQTSSRLASSSILCNSASRILSTRVTMCSRTSMIASRPGSTRSMR